MILKIEIFIIFVMCTTTSISIFIKIAITENVTKLYQEVFFAKIVHWFDRGDRLADTNTTIEQEFTVEDSKTPSIEENNDAASDVDFLEMEAEPSCMEKALGIVYLNVLSVITNMCYC